MAVEWKQREHVVWLQTAFLGDIILTTAAMKLLAEKRPQVKQYLITTNIGAKALAHCAYLQKILVFDKKLGSFFKTKSDLAALGLDQKNSVILQAHRSFRSSLLARLTGIPTVTYQESDLSFLAKRRVDRIAVFHEAHRLGLLLVPLGISREEVLASKPFLASRMSPGSKLWQERLRAAKSPIIGIAPGSRWGTKCWPVDYFSELVGILDRVHKPFFVFIGSKAEKDLTAHIYHEAYAGGIYPARLLDLAGTTDLEDLLEVFPKMDLLVTNDSSPVHYGSALQVPTLAIFGPTVPTMGFGPLAKGSKVVENLEISCRPCSHHGPMHCPKGHFACMRSIKPDQVAQAGLEILS